MSLFQNLQCVRNRYRYYYNNRLRRYYAVLPPTATLHENIFVVQITHNKDKMRICREVCFNRELLPPGTRPAKDRREVNAMTTLLFSSPELINALEKRRTGEWMDCEA